ncbi:MAG: CpsD/CapB family tyrosine-protein kinase [Candidatus Omnitrophica bacterium]|nr:CpsD/CapB family tyrosine-protein kinase [Candidatus Omnitrophota bacterium]
MSKISKALEKAAKDRFTKVVQERPTVRYRDPVKVAESRIDPHVVVYHDPHSPIAEQYKTLRTNLQALSAKQPIRTLGLTSAINSEGKTLTSINLAATMAQNDQKRIVLVDCDLRRGSIRQVLGLQEQPGVSEILSEGYPLDQALVQTQIPNLTILPAGATPDNPTELLDSHRMRGLIKDLREQFDLAIFDTPPIIPLTDAGVLGANMDGMILVVQSGRTQRKLVVQADDILRNLNIRTLGFILTHADYFVPKYGYGYYYGYRPDQKKAATGPANGGQDKKKPEQESE